MKIGTVMGVLQLQKCAPGYEQVQWKQVRFADQVLVAADIVGANSGDLVLLAEGPAANGVRMDLRCDALILGILEKEK